jgi:hypothetical protein
MIPPLEAKITRCREGRPLIEIESRLGNGMAVRPGELVALAERLMELACIAIDRDSVARYPGDKKIVMEIKKESK